MKLEGRLAIVTGAGSGIGRAIACLFAAEGARVVIAELDDTTGRQTADSIRDQGGEALSFVTDVADVDSVAKLFAALDQRDWPVDVLVNNAGITESELAPTAEVDDETWNRIMRVHLGGTFYCTREAIRRMATRKQGTIINLGSVAGLAGLPGASAYSAAKGGIISFTKAVSQEVGRQGIRVNCIAPGWIETPVLDHLPKKWRARMSKTTPLRRIGQPEEVASVAVFLASSDASFVTGQVISPNGGLHC